MSEKVWKSGSLEPELNTLSRLAPNSSSTTSTSHPSQRFMAHGRSNFWPLLLLQLFLATGAEFMFSAHLIGVFTKPLPAVKMFRQGETVESCSVPTSSSSQQLHTSHLWVRGGLHFCTTMNMKQQTEQSPCHVRKILLSITNTTRNGTPASDLPFPHAIHLNLPRAT